MSEESNLTPTKESLLKKVFSDPKNYPYGFSRSGDFSISESNALSQYGCYISALVNGTLKPSCGEDKATLAAAKGEIEPTDTAQRAWIKYQKRINRPKTGSIYGTQKTASRDDDELVISTEDDEDMDFDD